MKPLTLILFLSITTLVGCGEDVARDRGDGEGGTFIPVNPEDAFVTPSHLRRIQGTNVISSRDEIRNIVNNTLPAGYRIIPSMSQDNEGIPGTNLRPEKNCGFANNITVSERLRDCQRVNESRATWNASSGIAGESSWRLVSKAENQEVWIDTRTGQLWSDIVATTNWCNASGNTSDESGGSVKCSEEADNLTCIGKTHHNLTGVTWRLPTRNDYLQADLNGLRFALKPSTSSFWTATMNSKGEAFSEAWVYSQSQGTLEKALLTENRQVRCIGAVAL